jgi:hypothetical protein
VTIVISMNKSNVSIIEPTVLGLLYTAFAGLGGTISPLFGCPTTLAASLTYLDFGKCRAKRVHNLALLKD